MYVLNKIEEGLDSNQPNEFNHNIKNEFGLSPTEVESQSSCPTLSGIKLFLICMGLILAVFIAAVDETIVSTALGAITNDFKSSGQVTWVAGAYLLTMTAFEPIYGKFSDIFGRKWSMIFSLVLFLIGSIGCGAAVNIEMIIVFRALSGIGAGGLISLSFIIISDVTPIESRSTYLSLINGTFALSYVIGPLLGGVFVDYVNWRWVFYINIPIVVVTALMVIFVLPLQKIDKNFKEMLKRVDVLGTVTLVIGIILLVMALNWGGKEYEWSSPAVLVSLILGLVILGAFVYIEKNYAVEPVIPAKIFTKNAILLNLSTMLYGFSMFVYMYYWPLYHQTIHSASATKAGIETLPILVGICGFAAASGFIVTKTGRYRPLIWAGMVMLVVGSSLMSRLSVDISRAEEIIYPLLVGVGIGLCIQTCLVACQAVVKEGEVAIITAFVNFSLSIGGVLGLAIQGAIFNNVLTSNLTELVPTLNHKLIMESVEYLHSLPSVQRDLAIQAYLTAYKTMFLSLVPFSALSLLLCLFIKHIPLTTNANVGH